MSHDHRHPHNPEILNRLRRANGHLAKVIQMIEEDQPCLKVAQQLHAVSSAIEKAKQTFIHQHIEGCLDETLLDSPKNRKKHLEEFQEITKYL